MRLVVKVEALIGAVLASVFFGVWLYSDASIFFGWTIADRPTGHGMTAIVISPFEFGRLSLAFLSCLVLAVVVGVAMIRRVELLGTAAKFTVIFCLVYLGAFGAVSLGLHWLLAAVFAIGIGVLLYRAFSRNESRLGKDAA